jgi:hypothetical protein
MSGLALLLVLFVLARQQGGGTPEPYHGRGLLPDPPAPTPPVLPPIAKEAKKMPPPWPQAMPAGLPPFGPAGWVFDNPPPAAVQARAWQLLASLWSQGPGAIKTEQTAGRWITYQAQPMGKKKGVVAYRLRSQPPAVDQLPTNIPVS